MEILADLHTHTVASGHHTTATCRELALSASQKGLIYLGITDHAKGMLCAAKDSYFNILKMLSPKKIYGVNMLYGVELNILDYTGKVDLDENILKKLDYAIVSLHEEVIKPSSETANTTALLLAMDNPYVNILGHIDDDTFPVNFSLIAEKAAETNTIIELNSVSCSENGYRGDLRLRAKELLLTCKKYGCYISLGSDSHGKEKVGDFKNSLDLISEVDFPENKIVNTDINNFFGLVKSKRK